MLELGRISTLYGVLENLVNVSINKLAGYNEIYDYRSAIMLAHANFKQRVDILSTLFEQVSKDFPQLKDYESTIKLIKRAQKGRNKFMHSGLGFNPESGKVQLTSMSARGSLKTKVETVYVKEIIEVSAVIHEATCALHTIVTGSEMKPLWEHNA